MFFYLFLNKYDDVSFYREYAGKQNGEILELGCGTGRITLPLIETGLKVTAIDSSINMINRIKAKSQQK